MEWWTCQQQQAGDCKACQPGAHGSLASGSSRLLSCRPLSRRLPSTSKACLRRPAGAPLLDTPSCWTHCGACRPRRQRCAGVALMQLFDDSVCLHCHSWQVHLRRILVQHCTAYSLTAATRCWQCWRLHGAGSTRPGNLWERAQAAGRIGPADAGCAGCEPLKMQNPHVEVPAVVCRSAAPGSDCR